MAADRNVASFPKCRSATNAVLRSSHHTALCGMSLTDSPARVIVTECCEEAEVLIQKSSSRHPVCFSPAPSQSVSKIGRFGISMGEGHNLAQSGTIWHNLAQSGTIWHTLAQSGTLWHTLPLCHPIPSGASHRECSHFSSHPDSPVHIVRTGHVRPASGGRDYRSAGSIPTERDDHSGG